MFRASLLLGMLRNDVDERAQTVDGVGGLGHSDALVKDLHLQAPQRRPIKPVPRQEGAVFSVQGRRHVDADVLLLVQGTYLHFERVRTYKNTHV